MEKGGGELRVIAGEEEVEGCEHRREEASECEGDGVLRVVIRGEDGGGGGGGGGGSGR